MQSCLYEGTVTHCRREPVAHQFQYRLFMVYLDLDELPAVVGRGRLIAAGKLASRSFLREDHLFGRTATLADEVRRMIHQRTGILTCGPIRLLTQLRYFGYYFSPLNLFFVFDDRGERVEFVVAEVNNTPWNERHCYVLWDGNRQPRSDQLEFTHAKRLHVSPFMDMKQHYRWHMTAPGEDLSIQLQNFAGQKQLFDARLQLRRRALSRAELRRMMIRYPLMTGKIIAAIYFQAWKLWWKKCPVYTHPNARPNSRSSATVTTATVPTSTTNVAQ